jgi:putative cell wall-binding protein
LKHRTHRLRRLVASVTLGVGAMGGSLVALSGVASAAASHVGTFKTAAATTITAGNTKNQVIGTLILTITQTVAKGTFLTQVVTYTISDTTSGLGHMVAFTETNTDLATGVKITGPGTFTGCVFGAATPTFLTPSSTTLSCTVSKTTGAHTATGKTAPVVLTLHTARVNSISGQGKVKVTVADTTTPTKKFTPATGIAATYTPTTTLPTTVQLANTVNRPVPPIGEGTTGRPVGTWTLTLTSSTTTGSLAVNQGAAAGSSVKITIEPHTGTSVCATTDTVVFDGVPKFKVTTQHSSHISGTPTISGVLSGNNGCTGFFAPNVLTVMFTTAFKFTAKSGKLVIDITTVKYSVAPTTTIGTVTVSDAFHRSSSTKTGFLATTGQTTTVTSTNAVVSHAYVTVKTKKVVPVRSVDYPIGTIDVVESVAGTVPSGYVCLALTDSLRTTAPGWKNTTTFALGTSTPFYFNGAAKPSVKATTGNGGASTVRLVRTFTTTGRTYRAVSFKVTKSTTKTTWAVSGLAVNDYSTTGTKMPLVTGWYTSGTGTCTTGAASTRDPTDNVAVAFTTGLPPVEQIYGSTADATAVAELENVYGEPGFSCPETLGGHHPILLARDTFYSDALASQFLASHLNTGTLLTHPTSLSTVTKAAIAFEGITTVYVMGGPLAVSTKVISELKALPVYHCGGRKITVTTGTGVPKVMKVTRVAGTTEYGTALAISNKVPKTTGGYEFAQYAYSTGKNFNDTTGNESSKPFLSGSLKTAIVATGQGFQDAMSASALSYATHLPILLTAPGSLSSQAKAGLQNQSIQQVIVMGGPLAVSDAVVTAIEKMTISVIRVAGKTYSDTAVQLAKFLLGEKNGGIDWDQSSGGSCAAATTGGTAMRALVARGTFFSDGITSAVLQACGVTPFGHTFFYDAKRMPLLETMNPSTVGGPLTTYLKTAGLSPATGGTGVTSTTTQHLAWITVIGGPFAVNPSVIAAIQTDLKS